MAPLWGILLASLPAARIIATNITYPVVNVGSGASLKMATDDTCSVASWRIDSHPLGLPCVKIETGNESNNEGPVEVWVDVGSGDVPEADGFFDKGSVVLEKCYWDDVVSVKLKNSQPKIWIGTVSYSNNGGSTYAVMTCSEGCNGPSNSAAKVLAEKGNSGNDQADTRCQDGVMCVFVKRLLHCVKIITDDQPPSDGYLTASLEVDDGSGEKMVGDKKFTLGEVVLDKCYDREILKVKVKCTKHNAWVGTISHSSNGGNTYAVMNCIKNCDSPTQKKKRRRWVDCGGWPILCWDFSEHLVLRTEMVYSRKEAVKLHQNYHWLLRT